MQEKLENVLPDLFLILLSKQKYKNPEIYGTPGNSVFSFVFALKYLMRASSRLYQPLFIQDTTSFTCLIPYHVYMNVCICYVYIAHTYTYMYIVYAVPS